MALVAIGRGGRNGASALDIGNAVVSVRPPRHRRAMNATARERVGLGMAARLVHEGIVVATRYNRFMLIKYKGKAVPPLFESGPIYHDSKVPGTFGPASEVRVIICISRNSI
jgi:hypothetical protein